VDCRSDAAELTRQLRPHRCEARITQDFSRQRRTRDSLHQESFAEPVVRCEHVGDCGTGTSHACTSREHTGFRLQRGALQVRDRLPNV
jgi:hypothetical protein